MATSRSGDVSFWTNSPGTQPVAVYHAAWPGVLVPLHAQVTPSRPAAIAMDAGAILGPPAGTSLVYGPVFEHWTAGLDSAFTESRRFYLQRSLVDLVEAHRHLPLTDTELLRWYLMQCPEDRRLIQDEGGFHQFLRRHPGLKLHQDQLSVKYPQGAPGGATPSMHQYAPPPRPRAADPPPRL
ncbi:RNA-binding protein 44 [Menidia menidia]